MKVRTALIVEDNLRIRSHIQSIVSTAGYVAQTCDCGAAFQKLRRDGAYNIYIVDVGLPDVDGRELVRDVRNAGDLTPVLILSADGQIETKVDGLSAGADDYLTKPFHPRELVSRLDALVRRSVRYESGPLEFNDVLMSLESNEIWSGETRIALTRSEAAVLGLLFRAEGRIVRRESIRSVALRNDLTSDAAVDKAISRLRTTLLPLSHRIEVSTAKGVGFFMAVPDDA